MERGENRIRIEFALERRSRFAHDTDVLPLSIRIRWLYSVVPRGRLHCLPLSIGLFHSGRCVGPTDRWTEGRGQVTLDGRRCANRRSLARSLTHSDPRSRVQNLLSSFGQPVGRSAGRGEHKGKGFSAAEWTAAAAQWLRGRGSTNWYCCKYTMCLVAARRTGSTNGSMRRRRSVRVLHHGHRDRGWSNARSLHLILSARS